MRTKIRIPLKYKFLAVLLLITSSGIGTFLIFARSTFTRDKKDFLKEMNKLTTQVMQSELRSSLKVRMEEIGLLCQRIIQKNESNLNTEEITKELMLGFTSRIPEEVLSVGFYKRSSDTKKYEPIKKWENLALYKKLNLGETFGKQLEKDQPLPDFADLKPGFDMELLNRTVDASGPLPILTAIFPNTSQSSETLKDVIIVVDVLQNFLVDQLDKLSQISEAFVLSSKGQLVSHPNKALLLANAGKPFAHPLSEKLIAKDKSANTESATNYVSVETIGDEKYYVAIAEANIGDIYAVTQVKESQALSALKELNQRTLWISILVLAFSIIFSVLFAAGLTSNIQKLKFAAEEIGRGKLDVQLDIKSSDEVESVADSFQWMSKRLVELIKESAEKARMEEELETARLVQSTVLATPTIKCDAIELLPHYLPASECGGDFWDAYIHNNKLTILIGDATGHGAPAAIVTAVAKSCLYTLNSIYAKTILTPEQFLTSLNRIILAACKGRLLMTMCLIQLDLVTGEVQIANAGHESPLLLKTGTPDSGKKPKSEVLFSRGERLGFSADAKYTSIKEQLGPGDTILLYTDGISEAHNAEGKEFGERALKKAFAGTGVRDLSVMRDELVSSLKNHVKEAVQDDDITFVLLSWIKPLESTKTDQQKTLELKDTRDFSNTVEINRDEKKNTGNNAA